MPQGVWKENHQISAGSTAKAGQGAQGKGFEGCMQGGEEGWNSRQRAQPEQCPGRMRVWGTAAECGAAWSGWNMEYLKMRSSGGWSRLRSNHEKLSMSG